MHCRQPTALENTGFTAFGRRQWMTLRINLMDFEASSAKPPQKPKPKRTAHKFVTESESLQPRRFQPPPPVSLSTNNCVATPSRQVHSLQSHLFDSPLICKHNTAKLPTSVQLPHEPSDLDTCTIYPTTQCRKKPSTSRTRATRPLPVVIGLPQSISTPRLLPRTTKSLLSTQIAPRYGTCLCNK